MPGSAQCIANLLIKQKKLTEVSKKVVEVWGNTTIQLSRSRFCPRDTGKLQSTGKMDVMKNTLTEFHVRLSYNTPYARRQHETPWYHHPVGQWKYLSTPFNQRSPLLIKMLEAVWRAEL